MTALLPLLSSMETGKAQTILPYKLVGHGGPIKAIEISDDGRQALTSSFDYAIILWRLDGEEGTVSKRLEGHDAAVNDAEFVPGTSLAVSVSDDGSFGIWDLQSGTLVNRVRASEQKILDVSVSRDGQYAAVAVWDWTVRVFEISTGREVHKLEGHRGNVNSVAFLPDGSRLYSASFDGEIMEWDLGSGGPVRPVYRHGWGINSIAVIDEESLMFGAIDGSVGIVDLNGKYPVIELAKRDRPIQSVKVSSDGAFSGYGDGSGRIEVFTALTAKKIETGEVTYGPVWDFDFVPQTNQVYHVGLDDFATRWQISPRKLNQNKSEFPRRFQIQMSEDPGELEFQRKCSVCHTLTPDGGNRAGPTLHKLFGREAGTLPGYNYSQALLDADIIWNEETVSRLFDEGPDVVVPGTKMPIQRLKKIERREELIRFLKQATEPRESGG